MTPSGRMSANADSCPLPWRLAHPGAGKCNGRHSGLPRPRRQRRRERDAFGMLCSTQRRARVVMSRKHYGVARVIVPAIYLAWDVLRAFI